MKRGFTLIELMITAAIMGVLAAAAVPLMLDAVYAARRAELPVNVGAIRDASVAYEATFDAYASCRNHPRNQPDARPVPGGDGGDFQELGWAPDGDVRGVYSVEVERFMADSRGFIATGYADVDEDGQRVRFTATRDAGVTLHAEGALY